MKRIWASALAISGLVCHLRAQHEAQVQVVLNRPEAGGVVRVALCPERQAFEKEVGCVVRHANAVGDTVVLRFTGLRPGHQAAKVFHDVNDNGKLETNWMGIPREPYGFSNDAMGTFGPPSWEQARTPVEGVTVIRIHLKG